MCIVGYVFVGYIYLCFYLLCFVCWFYFNRFKENSISFGGGAAVFNFAEIFVQIGGVAVLRIGGAAWTLIGALSISHLIYCEIGFYCGNPCNVIGFTFIVTVFDILNSYYHYNCQLSIYLYILYLYLYIYMCMF